VSIFARVPLKQILASEDSNVKIALVAIFARKIAKRRVAIFSGDLRSQDSH